MFGKYYLLTLKLPKPNLLFPLREEGFQSFSSLGERFKEGLCGKNYDFPTIL
jgi:hypothetical protein